MTSKILIVEDNPDNLKLICWMLEELNLDLNLTKAVSGEEALQLSEDMTFDLVLMDINLPGIDGEETTRRLREKYHFSDTPIVAVTAHALRAEVENILSSGFNALITKPIDESDLLEVVNKFLSKNEG